MIDRSMIGVTVVEALAKLLLRLISVSIEMTDAVLMIVPVVAASTLVAAVAGAVEAGSIARAQADARDVRRAWSWYPLRLFYAAL